MILRLSQGGIVIGLTSGRALVLLILLALIIAPVKAMESTNGCRVIAELESETTPGRNPSDYTPHDFVRILGDEQFETQGWPGSGTGEDPYIIEGLNITVGIYHGIVILSTSAHYIIRHCLLTTQDVVADGIQLVNSANGTIENCIIRGGRFGVYMSSTLDCRVINSSIIGTQSGGIAAYYSNRPLIANNTIYGTERGIRFQEVGNGTVDGNTVYRASEGGIVMYSGTINNTMIRNRVGWNGPPNLIDPVYHAADHGNNSWDNNESIGNFWTGYNGSEVFRIAGTGNAADRFPSNLTDDDPPQINPHPDLDFLEGDKPPIINWTASDMHIYQYQVFRNGLRIKAGIWNSDKVSVQVGSHSIGIYNYTIILFDASEQRSVDTVIVTVFLVFLAGMGTEIVALASAIAVVWMAVVIAVFKRFNQ